MYQGQNLAPKCCLWRKGNKGRKEPEVTGTMVRLNDSDRMLLQRIMVRAR
jgi:hypothetical protein